MNDPVQVFWMPAGTTMPGDTRALVDVTDGDTPNIRMPVRLLSVDTPEVTARGDARAATIDGEFARLAEWIEAGKAPVSRALGEYLLPRLGTGRAGTLHYTQGKEASAFARRNTDARLTRPDGSLRNLFVRTDRAAPFDDNGRLLAYVAPNYSAAERRNLSRAERSTFNLDLVRAGWAAPFVIYPAVPGELDLPLLVEEAEAARSARRGMWAEPATLLAYEYRSAERLFRITRDIVDGADLSAAERFAWRERYCADMRTRELHGPEDYVPVPPSYRLWLWPGDLQEAVSRLNLVPSRKLAGAA